MKSFHPRQRRRGLVRPLAGAGIEITHDSHALGYAEVRPLAGAGIEIAAARVCAHSICRFAPSRGRELKYSLLLLGHCIE